MPTYLSCRNDAPAMIRFALACREGHDFESWFPSGSSYEAQAARGLVVCPVCGSSEVAKALMAPAIGKGGRRAEPVEAKAPAGPADQAPAPAPEPVLLLSERERALRTMLRAIREHVTKTADYVGQGFADEARRMHHGEIEHRSIYGEANAAEARALLEEGVEVHPLPIVPDDRN